MRKIVKTQSFIHFLKSGFLSFPSFIAIYLSGKSPRTKCIENLKQNRNLSDAPGEISRLKDGEVQLGTIPSFSEVSLLREETKLSV